MLDHPEYEHWLAGMKIIAAMGSRAEAAVPRLLERYESAEGQAPYEAVTLAAIGPEAAGEIAALEKYATPDSRYLADAYYALFCIRGQTTDLEKMFELLQRTDLNRPIQQRYVVNYLNALGVTAAPVADRVRQMLKEDVPPRRREGIEAFLEKVQESEGPFVLLQ